MIAKIGLQILQSGVIKYENELHFYSMTYNYKKVYERMWRVGYCY